MRPRHRPRGRMPPRISIHASRMGCDIPKHDRHNAYRNFNPRIPYGMRLTSVGSFFCAIRFQSTHPVWDATLCRMRQATREIEISIHASGMGCDPKSHHPLYSDSDFNPRIPYGMRPVLARQFSAACYFNPRIPYGMRPARRQAKSRCSSFQSTHPVWDATWSLTMVCNG